LSGEQAKAQVEQRLLSAKHHLLKANQPIDFADSVTGSSGNRNLKTAIPIPSTFRAD
jgi:hypothetical protein